MHAAKKEGNFFYFSEAAASLAKGRKNAEMFLLFPMWKLFTYFASWALDICMRVYAYIYTHTYKKRHGAPVWVPLHRRRDGSIARRSTAGGRLCHHSTTQYRKGHLNSGAVDTLAWQYSTWGFSTDYHVALEGYPGTAGLSSAPLGALHCSRALYWPSATRASRCSLYFCGSAQEGHFCIAWTGCSNFCSAVWDFKQKATELWSGRGRNRGAGNRVIHSQKKKGTDLSSPLPTSAVRRLVALNVAAEQQAYLPSACWQEKK